MNRARFGPFRLGVQGLGHVGLITGLTFAARGFPVVGYDADSTVRKTTAQGHTSYTEVGLGRLLETQTHVGRFCVVDSVEELVSRADVVFLCVPTPSLGSGRIDLRPLRASVKQFARAARSTNGYRLIVVKSTVVPGTTKNVVAPLVRRWSNRPSEEIGVAANPEFLAEGTMVRDAFHPARIVLGTDDARSRTRLLQVYASFRRPIFTLTTTGAELVKYSSNAFLALKISFANEIARLADAVGVNVDEVMDAVGRDPRIGAGFLRAGPGFGGSCFEKDIRALVTQATDLGLRVRSAEAALRINEEQLEYVLTKIRAAAGPLRGKTLALLGLSFKAGTDDVRESRALDIVHSLISAGARVRGHDPSALENFHRAWVSLFPAADGAPDLVDRVEDALEGADAAVLHADWPVYLRWNPKWTRRMKRPVLIDLRRSLDPGSALKAGLTVLGLGSGTGCRRVERHSPIEDT